MSRKAILISTEQYVKLYREYPMDKKVYDDNGNMVGIYDKDFHEANSHVCHGWLEGWFVKHTDGLWIEVEGATGHYN